MHLKNKKHEEETEIDSEYTTNITCPHCGYENEDSWEMTVDDDDIDCEVCYKHFNYIKEVSVTYSTFKIEKQT